MNTQNSAKPTSHCDELSELLPAFVAGALNPEEVEHVKALLQKCPQMQSEVAEYRTLMTGFYDRIEPVAPPSQLHAKLMKKVRAKKSEHNGADTQKKQQELYVALQTDLGDI
jgi:anti-sigma factor RsiW